MEIVADEVDLEEEEAVIEADEEGFPEVVAEVSLCMFLELRFRRDRIPRNAKLRVLSPSLVAHIMRAKVADRRVRRSR